MQVTPGRKVVGELMDRADIDDRELASALRYLRLINRAAGGTSAVRRELERLARRRVRERPLTMLDVGTGSADIPLAGAAWARRRGIDLRVTGVDFHAKTLAVARAAVAASAAGPAVELIEGRAQELERLVGGRTFDIVHAGLFIHHLDAGDVASVLSAMWRLCRGVVVWSDLVRSTAMEWLVRAGSIGQGPVVMHDAVASVRAGFTREEAVQLAANAGMQNISYRRTWQMYRFVLTARREG